jgi:hypothetical protein
MVLEDGYVLPPPPLSSYIWRDGKTLVMMKGSCLPDRCVRCNGPGNGYRLRRRLSWHHPALYILIFGPALFYLPLALALSKRATVEFGMCVDHERRRRILFAIGWGLLLLGMIMTVTAVTYEYALVGISGILLFVIALVWILSAYRIGTVKRIDDRYVWLGGMNEQFLQQFPPLPGAVALP